MKNFLPILLLLIFGCGDRPCVTTCTKDGRGGWVCGAICHDKDNAGYYYWEAEKIKN